jgi:hypothetical protein
VGNHEPKRTQPTQSPGFEVGATRLPEIIVSDVARAFEVKCFVYNEKSFEIDFSGGLFGVGVSDSASLS